MAGNFSGSCSTAAKEVKKQLPCVLCKVITPQPQPASIPSFHPSSQRGWGEKKTAREMVVSIPCSESLDAPDITSRSNFQTSVDVYAEKRVPVLFRVLPREISIFCIEKTSSSTASCSNCDLIKLADAGTGTAVRKVRFMMSVLSPVQCFVMCVWCLGCCKVSCLETFEAWSVR